VTNIRDYRYQLADAPEEDWQQAEKLIKDGKSTTAAVRVKDNKKRKAPGEALAEAQKEAESLGEKKNKKTKKSKR